MRLFQLGHTYGDDRDTTQRPVNGVPWAGPEPNDQTPVNAGQTSDQGECHPSIHPTVEPTAELLTLWQALDETTRQDLLAYARRQHEHRFLQHQFEAVPNVQDK